MAHWDKDAAGERDVLWRIVALLFALAALADLAAGLPSRRRRELVAILSSGEAEARVFVAGMAADASDLPGEAQPCGDAHFDADTAAVLAVRLRLLGIVLWFMLAGLRWVTTPCAASLQAGRRNHAAPAAPHRHAVLPVLDTS